jgi:hypothetical protein
MLFAAILTMRQSTDERNPFTAMLAIHGQKECIWGAKPVENGSQRKQARFEAAVRRVA